MSMGSRALFMQSYTSTIANYTMQTVLLSFYTLNLLEKASISFLWSDIQNSTKLYSIAWARIRQPKDHRGTGLRKLKDVNPISLTGFAWRLC